MPAEKDVFKLECPECDDLSLGVVEVLDLKTRKVIEYSCLRCLKTFKPNEVKERKY